MKKNFFRKEKILAKRIKNGQLVLFEARNVNFCTLTDALYAFGCPRFLPILNTSCKCCGRIPAYPVNAIK